MFVDQTPEGRLAKKLQAVEDRLAQASGYRIRMVELSGTQLSRLLPNTNPWAAQECGRLNCYTRTQGDENLEDCKARNILYESKCTLCNPEDVKKKNESSRKLGGVQGVYVGESARSIYERAGEHHGDMLTRQEDSHMIKHWLSSHQELKSPPKFKIKVVGRFQDSFTRQVSEAVRIELRGEHILNSRSEYSRCRIPRLVIDQEEWRKYKKKEVKELEPVRVQGVLEVDENGVETAEMLEEEKDLEIMESKEVKRKKKDENKPPA